MKGFIGIILALLFLATACAKQSPWILTPLPPGPIYSTEQTEEPSADIPQIVVKNFVSIISDKNRLWAFRLLSLTSTEGGWKAIIVEGRIGQKDLIYEVNATKTGAITSFSLIDMREMGAW